MGLLDGILEQIGGAGGIDAIAQKVGLPSEVTEQAIAALGQSHAEPGDTLEGAAAKTGLDVDQLGQIAQHLGGEGALGKLSGLLQDHPALSGVAGMLDRDGDGNPLNDIAGMAAGLFGKK